MSRPWTIIIELLIMNGIIQFNQLLDEALIRRNRSLASEKIKDSALDFLARFKSFCFVLINEK